MNDAERKDSRPPKTRGITFENEGEFNRAIDLLEEISLQEHIEYDLAVSKQDPTPTIIMPNWVFEKTLKQITDREIKFTELPVTPMSDLPPEEQARLRGWKRT